MSMFTIHSLQMQNFHIIYHLLGETALNHCSILKVIHTWKSLSVAVCI